MTTSAARSGLTGLLVTIGIARSSIALAAEHSLSFASSTSKKPIPAKLLKPDGNGPFPGVVILHDCSGLGSRSSSSPMRWAQDLVSQGYVVVLPDSFTPRGFPNRVCTLPRSVSHVANVYARVGDAYGALAALRRLPYVDGRCVALMGSSHRGITTLAAMVAPTPRDNEMAAAKRDGFTSAVALYPNCVLHYGDWSTRQQADRRGPVVAHSGVYRPTAPLLILIGAKDDWTPAEPCRELVETERAAGYPLDIPIYPGAYHEFDSDEPVRYNDKRPNDNALSGHGATTGGDAAAWADARAKVAAYFAQQLKSK